MSDNIRETYNQNCCSGQVIQLTGKMNYGINIRKLNKIIDKKLKEVDKVYVCTGVGYFSGDNSYATIDVDYEDIEEQFLQGKDIVIIFKPDEEARPRRYTSYVTRINTINTEHDSCTFSLLQNSILYTIIITSGSRECDISYCDLTQNAVEI